RPRLRNVDREEKVLPGDRNPNSVFTRTLLKKLDEPNLSIVQIAKATQVSVRDLAAQVGHTQLPSYYDQIIGTVRLNPGTPGSGDRGTQRSFKEGETALVLPKIDPAPKPGKAQPLANFSRSNQGWQVSVSLPEPALQFGYRTEPEGEFTVTGHMAALDPRTGAPMPVTWFSIPGDHPEGTLYVTWRDKRGEEAGVFPIKFSPDAALRGGQKQILEQLWTAWVAFPGSNKGLMYFTHLMSYRCGIAKVEYAFNEARDFKTWPMPKCDKRDPHAVPSNAKIYRKVPRGAKSAHVRLTYFDGSASKVRRFNIR
ncbi:MAG: caspase family protein, partial [Pseudomonadota bacterium]